MEMIFLVFMLICLTCVVGIDAARKRHKFLETESNRV